jgi:hypothetical protein
MIQNACAKCFSSKPDLHFRFQRKYILNVGNSAAWNGAEKKALSDLLNAFAM